ncbi:MAG: nuclear transport factor 2 family protein [Spongiibacteraceae bacterium]|nr:nuclear transport factor 2 family protein [Spongiibacteraceae bacterium]
MMDQSIEELLAKQAINEVLSKYCSGLDRMHKGMAYAAFHKNATAIYHEVYKGTGRGFVDWVWSAHEAMERHFHQISNVFIEVAGDTATSEAYVTAVSWTLPEKNTKQVEIIGRGRYLDQWRKKQGHWAIEHREHVLDMQSLREVTPGPVSCKPSRDVSLQVLHSVS